MVYMTMATLGLMVVESIAGAVAEGGRVLAAAAAGGCSAEGWSFGSGFISLVAAGVASSDKRFLCFLEGKHMQFGGPVDDGDGCDKRWTLSYTSAFVNVCLHWAITRPLSCKHLSPSGTPLSRPLPAL